MVTLPHSPDLDKLEEHIRWLYGSLDPGEVLYIAPADEPKACTAVASIDEAIQVAKELSVRGTFVSSGVFQAETSREREHLLSIPAFAFDCDLKDWLIANGRDPETVEAAIHALPTDTLSKLTEKLLTILLETLARFDLSPSSVVYTGHGLQAYLLIDFLETREVPRIIVIQKALVRLLNEAAGFELCDTNAQDAGTRYVHVPGTANTKSTPPRWATIVQNSGPTYGLDQLEAIAKEYLQSEEEAPEPDAEESQEQPPPEVIAAVVKLLVPIRITRKP
jgi:hypothetical protein